jgi:nicotinamidase/pyrazinamidase
MNALILIDLSNDFCPGGMVEVPGGNQVVEVANRLMEAFELVVSVRDWHPAGHLSFAANHLWRRPGQEIELHGQTQLLWPMHCVQNSFGAELAMRLRQEKITRHFFKGTDAETDSYSAFFDNLKKNDTGLATFLHENGVEDVYLIGLPCEFGVRYSALDALALGFRAWVVADGCRAIHGNEPVFKEIQEQGGQIILSEELLQAR